MWARSPVARESAGNKSQLAQQTLIKYKLFYADKNKIGPLGCRVIASSPNLQNLKSLELNNNKIKVVRWIFSKIWFRISFSISSAHKCLEDGEENATVAQ